MLTYPTMRPYDAASSTINAINAAGGMVQNQTALLELEELRRQQASAAHLRQAVSQHPDILLGGGPGGATIGTLGQGGPPGAITQGPLPGMPGQTQTIGAPQDLSRFATGQPPQSTIGTLGQPPPQPDPLRALMQRDPDAGLKMLDMRFKAQERVLGMQEKKMAAFGQILQGATDQASWEQAREQIRQVDPQAAARMSPQFSKEERDRWVMQALSVQDNLTLRLAELKHQRQIGLQTTPGVDAQGNPVLIQPSTTGEGVVMQLPPGVRPAPATSRVDLGTSWGIVDRSGQVVQTIPKDVAGEATQKAAGQETGKYAGEKPQRMQEARTKLTALDTKQDRVLAMLTEAEQLVDQGWFTTGLLSHPASLLPGDARRLAGVIKSIRSNIGLTELQDLKASGTGLGSVTEAEHTLLQSILGVLEQGQSAAHVKKSLAEIRQALQERRTLRNEAYQREFGTTSSAQTSQAPTGGKVVSRAALHAEADRRGVSREQAEAQARQKGYEVR